MMQDKIQQTWFTKCMIKYNKSSYNINMQVRYSHDYTLKAIDIDVFLYA
jgi:hypothetical protein